MKALGVVLIVLGVLALAYGGFTYTHQKKVMPPLLLFLMLMFIATSVNLLVAFLYPVFSHRGKGF